MEGNVSGYVCNHGSPNGERDTASPRLWAMLRTQASDEEADDVFSRRHLYCGTPVVTSWAVAGQQVVFLHMYLQTRVTLRAFPVATPRGPPSGNHGYIRNLRRFQMSRHLEMPPEVPLLPFTLKCLPFALKCLPFTLKCLPFTLKCLPFALKSSRTSTYEITCIHVYT